MIVEVETVQHFQCPRCERVKTFPAPTTDPWTPWCSRGHPYVSMTRVQVVEHGALLVDLREAVGWLRQSAEIASDECEFGAADRFNDFADRLEHRFGQEGSGG